MQKCGKEMRIYSRIVGYVTDTAFWNKGKKEEFRIRKTMALNSDTLKTFEENLEAKKENKKEAEKEETSLFHVT